MQDSDPIATAQQAHRDIGRTNRPEATSRLSGRTRSDRNTTPPRHARPYGTALDINTGKARPQRVDPVGNPADYERPDAKTIAAGIALTLAIGTVLSVVFYAVFAGWDGPL